MRPLNAVVSAFVAGAIVCVALGQDQPGNDKFVSKEDYRKLKEEHDQLKREMEELKARLEQLSKSASSQEITNVKAQVEQIQKKAVSQQTETDQALDEMDKGLKEVKQMAKDSFPGSTKMLLTGYGSATYTATRSGYGPAQPLPPDSRDANSSFTATFNPIFLWKLSDRLFFEGEMELELEGSETSVALEMAHVSYLLNDYVTVSAGKFLNPIDYFVERQHMAWVNKLPDKPLAVYDGLLPESLLGVQVRGGIPVGPTKIGYAFYAANAPELTTSPADPANPMDVGTLTFDDFDNSNGHIAAGGRVGFYPIPELEVGYGFQTSAAGPKGSDVHALLQSVDLSYVRDSDFLKGMVNLHAQWVWSNVDRYTYDATGAEGFGPLEFSNNRNGGYAQLAYRPSKLENSILKDIEPVVRYDVINQKKTPVGFDERRWTVGLNYWIGPSTVFKLAYEFDRQNGTGQDGDAFLAQFAVGF
jgi:gas vesicle protein